MNISKTEKKQLDVPNVEEQHFKIRDEHVKSIM